MHSNSVDILSKIRIDDPKNNLDWVRGIRRNYVKNSTPVHFYLSSLYNTYLIVWYN